MESSQQWTSKYKPLSIKEMVGNINIMKEAIRFTKDYRCARGANTGFPKAIVISGSGGIGKTTFARLLALYRGFIPIEFNASSLRRKKEVSAMVDMYKTDIRKTIDPKNSDLLEAQKNLKLCNMSTLGVGKAIIIDELDAMGKGDRGLSTILMDLIKKKGRHDPNRILIITCDEHTLTRFKTFKTWCHVIKFKRIIGKETIKLIDRVCDGENITLTEDDKLQFINYANGDCRRLLNGMEMCFKNGVSKYTIVELSKTIKLFVEGDEETIKRLKYSSLSSEKILHNLIQTVIDGDGRDMINVVTTDMYAIALQLFKIYPDLTRNDINWSDQLNHIVKASDSISCAEYYIDSIRCAPTGENFIHVGENYIMQSILGPIFEMKEIIPKRFKTDVSGYAKSNGIKTSVDSQYRIKQKIGEMAPSLFGKSFEEIRYFSSWVGKMLYDKKYKELAVYFHDNNIDRLIIDELVKIKILNTTIYDELSYKYFGVKLSSVWKTTTKREFKKQYVTNKPKTHGVKFRDGKKPVKKILFFERFENKNKKRKI